MASPATAAWVPAGSSRRWTTLGVLTLLYVLNFVDRQLPSILAKPIQDELGLTDGQLGLLGGLYFALFYGVLSIPVAWLADRANRVRVVAVACTLWSVATIACGLSRGYGELAVARLSVGIGEAGGVPPSYSILSDLFPAERRATALAVYNLGPPIGQMLGVAGGAALAASGGWRHAFIVVGAIGIVMALVAFIAIREPKRGALDPSRAESPAEGMTGAPSFGEALRGFWADRVLGLAAFAAGASAFIGSGTLAFLTLFLMREKGMTLAEVGAYFSVLLGVCVCGGIYLSGWLVDRLAPRFPGAYGLVPAGATVIALPFYLAFVAAPGWPLALGLLAVPLFCNYFYLTPAVALVQSRAPVERRAVYSAILLLVMNVIGLGFGPTLLGAMSDVFRASHPEHSLQMAFYTMAPVFVIATLLHLMVAARLRREAAGADTAPIS